MGAPFLHVCCIVNLWYHAASGLPWVPLQFLQHSVTAASCQMWLSRALRVCSTAWLHMACRLDALRGGW